MHGQLELGFFHPSAFSLCQRHPLPLARLKISASLGGRILPIVGGNNTGAEFLLQECLMNADSLNWKSLLVKVGPSGAPCHSAVVALAEKLDCYLTQGESLFGQLPVKIREANFRLILIEGASHLSDTGVWEMIELLEDIISSNKGGGPPPLFVWHARPNWEEIFRCDDPPRQYFLGDVVLPPVSRDTSEQEIETVFPALGRLLKTSKQANEHLFAKTDGRIGLCAKLEEALSLPVQYQFDEKNAGEALHQLLEVIVGIEAPEGVVTTRPPQRHQSAHLPGSEPKYNPHFESRSRRGRRGKRRKTRN